MFHFLLIALLGALLAGGWTAAWLSWSFRGDIRAWLVAVVFPEKWRNGYSRKKVSDLSPDALNTWLAGSSRAPLKVVMLLACPYCLSAHIAGVGTLLLWLLGGAGFAHLLFVWAGGAAIGILLYVRSKN